VLTSLPDDPSYYLLSDDLKASFKVSNFDGSYSNANNVSYGGHDLEDLGGIQKTAPRYFSSVGRLVTKNDYYSFITRNYPSLQAVSVIGGEEMVPHSDANLGNVFMTAIPELPLNFNLAKNIYLTDLEENEMILRLNERSIISTRRKFYKPNYVYLDLKPYIEFEPNTPSSVQSSIMTTGHDTLVAYFNENFNSFGKLFRMSKVESQLDSLPKVISSSIAPEYYFIINDNSFYAASSTVGINFAYLPVIAVRDSDGAILSYKNFVETNVKIVDELLLSEFGINIAAILQEENGLSLANAARYPELIKLLPSESSIYGTLYHPYLSRSLFNADFSKVEILKISTKNSKLAATSYAYLDTDNIAVTTGMSLRPDGTYDITFTKNSTSYIVGNITRLGASDVEIVLDTAIMGQFGFANSEISPITKKVDSPNQYVYVYLNVIGNESFSELQVYGRTELIAVDFTQGNPAYIWKKALSIPSGSSSVPFVGALTSGNYTLKYANNLVATLEANVNQFRGYIEDNKGLTTLMATAYSLGDYVQLTATDPSVPFMHTDTYGIEHYFEDRSFMYFDGNSWQKVNYLRDVDATHSASLLTNDSAGDIYLITAAGDLGGIIPGLEVTDYIYFNPESTLDPVWKFEKMRNMGALDASNILPAPVADRMIRLVILDDLTPSTNFGGLTTSNFVEDDLIYYDHTQPIYADRWKLITKLINPSPALPTMDATQALPPYVPNTLQAWQISNTGDFSVTENGLTVVVTVDGTHVTFTRTTGDWTTGLKEGYFASFSGFSNTVNDRIFQVISVNALVITALKGPAVAEGPSSVIVREYSDNISWSPENVAHRTATADVLVSFGDGDFSVFDHFPSFNVDGTNPAALPIELNVADWFDINSSGNFQGGTDHYYVNTESIVYAGNSTWMQFIVKGNIDASAANLPVVAGIGDVLGISVEGNFENSVLLDSTDRFCVFEDLLIWNGSRWQKLYPYTAIVDGSSLGGKHILNSLGMRSNLFLRYDPASGYYSVMAYDIFDRAKLGSFNYHTGKIVFENTLDGYLDKITPVANTYEYRHIKKFFENYDGNTVFDKIRMLPDKDINGVRVTDFDTLFNQMVVANINAVQDINEKK
jgi:hypothetical protein